MGFFDVTIEGLDSIQQELNIKSGNLYSGIAKAMHGVAADFVTALQKRIQSDWYMRYEPIHYVRRTDNPGLGIPLGDAANMTYSSSGATLSFDYNPMNGHAISYWDNRAYGDDLIKIIQDGTGGHWNGKVPPRPFWNNFVEDLEHGLFFDLLDRNLPRDYSIDFDSETVLDLSEFKL